MKLEKPVEKMTHEEIFRLFRKSSEPRFTVFLAKLEAKSAEQFVDKKGVTE